MKLLQALLLSLGVHFLIMLILANMPAPTLPQSNAVIVEFEPKKLKDDKQIVHSSILPDKYKVQETEDKLKFLSDRYQRVRQQSQAYVSGLTKNSNGKSESSPQKKAEVLKKLEPKYDITPKHKVADSALDDRPSTISDKLPNQVKKGQVTALNTDQYLFASFFERVSDLVYIRWATLVRQAQDNLMTSKINYNSSNTWTTQVEIQLKPNGEFLAGHILKPSGIPEFDRAAVMGFSQARMFPNPPKELVDPEDKIIRLKYALSVYFDPKVLVSK